MQAKFNVHQEIRKYIPLLILPVIFSLFFYAFIHNSMQKQLKTEAEQNLDYFSLQMSSMTRETEVIAENLSSDFTILMNHPDTVSLSYSFSNPYSINTQIEIRKSDSSYIDHIYFVCESEDAIYSDYGYYTYGSLSEILSGLDLSTEEFLSIEWPQWEMSTLGMLREPFYVMPFRDEEGNIIGRLLFTISLDQFTATISSLDAEYACLYNDKFLIVSQPLDTIFTIEDISTEAGVSALLGKSVKCFYIEKDDYTYMVAFDYWSYYTPLIWMIIGFIIYILLVIIVDYLYLFRVSKTRGEEITTLVNLLPQEADAESHTNKELLLVVQNALLNAADLRKEQKNITSNMSFTISFTGTTLRRSCKKMLSRSISQPQVPHIAFPTSPSVNGTISHYP